MKKQILVIEDNEKHIQDAKDFFRLNPDVDVICATNYLEARNDMFKKISDAKTGRDVLSKGNIDGVISDIYFPLSSNEPFDQPEPIGVRVAVELSQLSMPFVLNTAGYHHGIKYEWINQLARSQNWKLVDTGRDYEKDSDSKNWQEAYQTLERMIK